MASMAAGKNLSVWICLAAMGAARCSPQYLDALGTRVCGSGLLPLQDAQPAAAFMNSLGLTLDLAARDSRNADPVALLADLRALGVHNVKSDALGVNDDSIGDYRLLGRNGISLLLQLNTGSDVAQLVRDVGPSLTAVQIPSPNDGGSLNPPSAIIASLADKVSRETRALPAFPRPLVIGPLIFGGEDINAIPDLRKWVDRGALRYAFQPPGGPDLPQALQTHQRWYGEKALWATAGGGYPIQSGSSELAVSPRVQAKYMLRFFLELYRRGVERAYYTKLYDNDEYGYGLATADGIPRPSFHAMAALAAVMRDEGLPQARPLEFKIEDPQGVDDSLHHLLFQRSDGIHVLLLWLEVRSVEQDQSRSVTVRVDPQPFQTTYRVLESPSVGGRRLPPGDVMVEVTDFPVALELHTTCR